MPSKYRQEWRALLMGGITGVVGTLWGWAFATAGQVPWWTYFVVCVVSVFLCTYGLFSLWAQQTDKLNAVSIPLSVAAAEDEAVQLREAALYRKNFLADVSHELKTSVFIAQGFLDALQADSLSKPQREVLQRTQRAITQLKQLVEDVLTTSLMEHGNMCMQYSCFDMHALCVELCADFYTFSKQRRVKLSLRASSPPLWAYADRKYLQQVMRNLVQNAIAYNRTNGSVSVQLQCVDQRLHVAVEDTGCGIAVAEQKHIFERYYRVEKSRAKQAGGTGIGLSLVKQVLAAHNTPIQLHSQVGVGSVFSFSLPMAAPE